MTTAVGTYSCCKAQACHACACCICLSASTGKAMQPYANIMARTSDTMHSGLHDILQLNPSPPCPKLSLIKSVSLGTKLALLGSHYCCCQVERVTAKSLLVSWLQDRQTVVLPRRPDQQSGLQTTRLSILAVFEFNSHALRSGVIVKSDATPSSVGLLFVKGAHTAIKRLLQPAALPPDFDQVGGGSELHILMRCTHNQSFRLRSGLHRISAAECGQRERPEFAHRLLQGLVRKPCHKLLARPAGISCKTTQNKPADRIACCKHLLQSHIS